MSDYDKNDIDIILESYLYDFQRNKDKAELQKLYDTENAEIRANAIEKFKDVPEKLKQIFADMFVCCFGRDVRDSWIDLYRDDAVEDIRYGAEYVRDSENIDGWHHDTSYVQPGENQGADVQKGIENVKEYFEPGFDGEDIFENIPEEEKNKIINAFIKHPAVIEKIKDIYDYVYQEVLDDYEWDDSDFERDDY